MVYKKKVTEQLFKVVPNVPNALNKCERHFRTPGSFCQDGSACRIWSAKMGRVDLRVFEDQQAKMSSERSRIQIVTRKG